MMEYSVVIPAHNAAETLAEAITSVLRQDPPPSQVIVVDDGSTDATAHVAQQFGPPVQVICQSNRGPGSATNTGIAAASQEILAFLDADDIWLPGKMARQLTRLNSHRHRLIVTARMRQFRHGIPDDGTGEERDGPIRSTLVCDQEVFARVGPIISPPGHCGDMIDWFSRARSAGIRFENLPEVLALRRIIPGSLTYTINEESRRAFLKIAHAALRRNRGNDNGARYDEDG